MNICFLTKDYFYKIRGGVGSYVYEISRVLYRLGHKVFIITLGDKDNEYEEDGIIVFQVKARHCYIFDLIRDKIPGTIERLEYSMAVAKKLKEIVGRYGIDIVESYEARAEGFWYYLFRKNPPLIIKLHTPEGLILKWNGVPESLDTKLIRKLEQFWLMRARKLIGVTKAITGLMEDLYGLNSFPVIYNPFDIDKFNANYNQILSDLEGNINILYVGRLEFRKGVHILVKAIPKVLKKIPKARFIFIGNDCGMRWFLEKKCNEFDCIDKVFFIPHIPRQELIDYYLKATLCIVPSIWENFPYTCLEPMALGKAVIASDTGGIKEIIDDGINGILFKTGSSLDLAEKIILLCLNNDFRKKIEDNAKKKIESLCNPEKIAMETLKIYENCIR